MDHKEKLNEEDDWAGVFDAMYTDEADSADSEGAEEIEASGASEDTGAQEEAGASDGDANGSDPEAEAETEDSEDGQGTEEVAEEDAKPAVAEVLERLRAVDPSIQSFNDLEDVGLFAVLLDRGIEPEEALRMSSPKLRARAVEQTKATSKKHMRATAASARDDAIDMEAIKMFRAARPGISEKEAIALYRRVSGK